MTVVFTKSAASLAKESFVGATVCAAFGALFAGIVFLADDIGMIVRGIVVIVAILCVVWAQILVQQGRAYQRSGRDERAEVTDRKLSWQSPVQEIMPSFEVPYSNIQTLRRVRTKRRSSRGTRYSDAFSIELHKGDTIRLSTNGSGLSFEKVFDAMRDKGVPYEMEEIDTKDRVRNKKQERLARRQALKSGKQTQAA